MKITQIMLAKGFGGAERYFVDLSLALAEQGHHIQAVCHHHFYGRDMLAGHAGIELQSFSVLGWWDPFARINIQTAINKYQPDVMHAHLARAAYIGGKISQRLNIPLVVKTHNYVDLKYYRDVNLFLPTTRDQQKYLLEHGIAAEKIRVVPNFSSLAACDDIQSFSSQDKPLKLGTVGRLVKKKGFDLLVQAFRHALNQGLNGQLLIGGDGPELAHLEEEIKKLGCEDSVRLCGWVEDVEKFMTDIDIFVMSSLDEPFGIVILEAMARGKVIISTRTQGPSEILDDDNAFLVDTADMQGLTNAMLQVAKSSELARTKAGNALKKFTEEYSKDIVVPRLVELYEQIK